MIPVRSISLFSGQWVEHANKDTVVGLKKDTQFNNEWREASYQALVRDNCIKIESLVRRVYTAGDLKRGVRDSRQYLEILPTEDMCDLCATPLHNGVCRSSLCEAKFMDIVTRAAECGSVCTVGMAMLSTLTRQFDGTVPDEILEDNEIPEKKSEPSLPKPTLQTKRQKRKNKTKLAIAARKHKRKAVTAPTAGKIKF